LVSRSEGASLRQPVADDLAAGINLKSGPEESGVKKSGLQQDPGITQLRLQLVR
jgi:hypothetical protein